MLRRALPRDNTSPEPGRPNPPASTRSPVLVGRSERETPKHQSPDPRPSPGTPAGGRVRPAWLLVTGKAAEAASAPMLATGAEAPRQPPHGHSANASQYLGAHRVSGAPPSQRVSRNLCMTTPDDTRATSAPVWGRSLNRALRRATSLRDPSAPGHRGSCFRVVALNRCPARHRFSRQAARGRRRR